MPKTRKIECSNRQWKIVRKNARQSHRTIRKATKNSGENDFQPWAFQRRDG